jgi:RHS repeat-associated protein
MKNNRFAFALSLISVLFAVSLCARAQSALNATDYDVFLGNFNGEAKSEALFIAKDPSWPSGMATLATPIGDPFFLQTWPSDHLGITWSTQVYNVIVADFNGNGRSDILLARKTSGYSYIITTNADGTLAGISQSIAPGAFGLDWTEAAHNLVAGDFNGDGKADLFFQAKNSAGTNAILLADSNGGLFTASSGACWGNGPHLCWSDGTSSFQGLKWAANAAVVATGDFNGDGKSDFLVRARPKLVLIDYDVPIPVPTYPPYMNGVILSQSSGMAPTFSVGQYFSRRDLGTGVDWSPQSANVVIGDFNGDGRDDIVLQALRSGTTSFRFQGNANGTLATGVALANNVSWSADATRLFTGSFGAGGGVEGLYFQAVSASGLSGFAQTITGGSVTLMGTGTPSDVNTGFYYLPGTGILPVTSAGNTPGNATVEVDGTGTYTIPLELPAGINDLTPKLSIVYRHNSAPGLLGPRWTVSGLSAITRCLPKLAQNGHVGGLSYTTSDRYCLDGNQLKLTTGSYAATNSQYRTELETYARITVKGANGTGPTWFEVYGKDGLIYEYGNTGDSNVTAIINGGNVTTTWALNKIRDRAQNYITFTYFQANGSYTPTQIQYTGNSASGVTPAYSIQFGLNGLVSLADAPYFVSNFLLDSRNEYLDHITVSKAGVDVTSYRFSYYYGTSITPRRALLSGVQRCKGTDCLAPTTFRWRPEAVGWSAAEGGTLDALTSGGSGASGQNYPADINGDGYEDVIYLETSTDRWKVLWGSATGFNGTTDTTHADSQLAYAVANDFDKNGSMDLLIRRTTSSNWWWLRRQSNGTFAYSDLGTPVGPQLEKLLDFNGDGYEDLVGASADKKSLIVRLHTNAAASFSGSVSTYFISNSLVNALITGNPLGVNARHRNMDINGDGRHDVIASIGGTWRVLYSAAGGFTLGDTLTTLAEPIDLNSDHCTDLLVRGSQLSTHTSKCRIESGAGLHPAQYAGVPQTNVAPLVVDWDGDGYDDILYSHSGSWMVARSNGIQVQAATATSFTVDTATLLLTSDVDGNGRPDLVFTNAGKWWLRRNLGSQPFVVAQARDSFGNSVDFSYQNLAANSCYAPGTPLAPASLKMLVTGPVLVACGLTVSDGTGGSYVHTFSYENGLIHLQGRGFSGFGKRIQTDGRTGIIREETLSQNYPWVGMPTFVRFKQSNGTKILETSTSPAELTFGSGFDMTHFPYAQSTTQDSYEVGGVLNGVWVTRETTTVTLDAYGTATNTTRTLIDKDSVLTPLNQTFTTSVGETITNSDGANWCLGRSSQSVTTMTLPDSTSQTKTIGRDIDYAACRVTRETIEPGIPALKVVTDFEYLPQACGNVSAVTVTGHTSTGTPLLPRVTSFNYGTACRFPELITNAESQVTQMAYHEDFGLPQTQTDPNGLVTSWTYDNFARRTRETRPDGTYTDVSYTACTATAPCGAADLRLQVQTTERDSAGGVMRAASVIMDSYERVRVTKEPLASGALAVVERTYDQLGRLATQTTPSVAGSNGKTTFGYDLLSRQTSEELRDGSNVVVRLATTDYRGRTVRFTDPRSNVTTKVADVAGQLRRVTDPVVAAPSASGTTQFDYTFEAGGVLRSTVTDPAANVMTLRRNLRGFQTQLVDPDVGTVNYEYDSFGELTKQTDAKGTHVTFGAYDKLGRPTTRTEPEGTTTWTWGTLAHNTPTAKYIGRLKKVETTASTYSETHTYDALGRLTNTAIVVPSDTTYQIDQAYHATTGRLDTLTYPTSSPSYRLKLQYEYQHGHRTKISDANAPTTVFWQLNAMNAMSQSTDESLGNTVRVVSGFNAATGLLTSRQAGAQGSTTNRHNLAYEWDATGNLTRRTDNNQGGLYESFVYDALNRLDSSTRNGVTNLNVTIDAIGNLTLKSDVSASAYNYTTQQAGCTYYGHSQPHAVRNVAGNAYCYDQNGNMTSRAGSSISWTSYNLPSVINSGTASSTFSYGPSRNRFRQMAVQGGVTTETIYVAGLLEKVTIGAGVSAYRHYIAAESSMVIHTRFANNATPQTYYVVNDHLSSHTTVTDGNGGPVVAQSFDAYGKRRGSNWTGAPSAGDLTAIASVTRRGFTGHEHLDDLGLVHMNGRVEDPTLGRFLSADPLTRQGDDTQAFNRYSYVKNNPLTLVDPTGMMETVIVTGRVGGEVDLPGDKLSILLSSWLKSGVSGSARVESSAQIGVMTVQASRITTARLAGAGPANLAALTQAGSEVVAEVLVTAKMMVETVTVTAPPYNPHPYYSTVYNTAGDALAALIKMLRLAKYAQLRQTGELISAIDKVGTGFRIRILRHFPTLKGQKKTNASIQPAAGTVLVVHTHPPGFNLGPSTCTGCDFDVIGDFNANHSFRIHGVIMDSTDRVTWYSQIRLENVKEGIFHPDYIRHDSSVDITKQFKP